LYTNLGCTFSNIGGADGSTEPRADSPSGRRKRRHVAGGGGRTIWWVGGDDWRWWAPLPRKESLCHV